MKQVPWIPYRTQVLRESFVPIGVRKTFRPNNPDDGSVTGSIRRISTVPCRTGREIRERKKQTTKERKKRNGRETNCPKAKVCFIYFARFACGLGGRSVRSIDALRLDEYAGGNIRKTERNVKKEPFLAGVES